MSIGGSRDFETYILEYNDSKKRWELNKRGASRSIRTAQNKYTSDIESEARRIAKNQAPSELRIETANGGTASYMEYER